MGVRSVMMPLSGPSILVKMGKNMKKHITLRFIKRSKTVTGAQAISLWDGSMMSIAGCKILVIVLSTLIAPTGHIRSMMISEKVCGDEDDNTIFLFLVL